MKFLSKIVTTLCILGCAAIFTGYAMPFVAGGGVENAQQNTQQVAQNDTLPDNDNAVAEPLPVSVKPLETIEYQDLEKNYPVDLKTPENVKTEVSYDYQNRTYVIHTKIGDMDIASPFVLSEDEYKQYTLKQDMDNYWREKNADAKKNYEDKFNITDMKFSLGPADKLFGPGGVQVKTQGSAEIIFGIKHNNIQNYQLSERLRKTTTFDFDEKIQLNVNASVGDKIKFNMNYDTESTFDFDRQNLKLGYEGKEDDWLKKIEAGNVSMNVNSALIPGSTALFGIKTDMQFGKMKVSAVVSQQQSSSQNVNTNGGARTIDFEVPADQYDANRHYFLSQYFRDHYDESMLSLPRPTSSINITKIEVWVTNKRARYDQARNIIAFTDLGEEKRDNANNKIVWAGFNNNVPANNANNVYSTINSIGNIRDIQYFTQLMSGFPDLIGGEDYEKIESARLLEQSEYTLNPVLGFISLRTSLNADEVLAVAFQYRKGETTYQVGDFATDGISEGENNTPALMVKLLKATSVNTQNKLWKLMMKNIYSLGASSFQQQNFKLNIMYRNDSTGVYLNYIPVGNIAKKVLLKVMNLDRLDSYENPRPDGKFDFVEGYTIISSMGRVIFPEVEPFGHHLAQAIGTSDSTKYCYPELYDTTFVAASEVSEKNKFKIVGSYEGTSNSEIYLNAMNVPRGSVKVTSGGITLVENVDYTVDYIMGVVTILNQSILSSNTPVDVRMESREMFNMQRKTLLGTHLEYAFNKDFTIGGTLMHLSEMPIVTKTMMGSEPISNTIWGLNAAYRKNFQWLTTAIDKLPLLEASAPSSITLNAEVAQMIPGHRKIKGNPGYAYLDDFEATKTTIDLRYPYYWALASTPSNAEKGDNAMFPEATKSDDVIYGKNRAQFAWFSIDNSVFNLDRSSTMPQHLKNDKDARSNHFTRYVMETEVFPNREPLIGNGEAYLPVLNVSFYPQERGQYNLDAMPTRYSEGIGTDGKLLSPKKRWGGMMRKIESSDFEQSNIEYIEFWLMDPFVNDTMGTHSGGKLYINLGDISEDVLKDGRKFFENGMPENGDTLLTQRTAWGRVPTQQSTVLAFSSDRNARKYQDVGFNGLRTEDELNFTAYADYITELRARGVSSDFIEKVMRDPAGDNFHHYRGSDYDTEELPILLRYKYYNGTEGNSAEADNNGESYITSATSTPDVEDINQDNTLNEYEKYFQYGIPLKRDSMEIGRSFIIDKRVANVKLANGTYSNVTWYQYKIPIGNYEDKIGGIRDFKSIRFMRMFLTDFEQEIHLRFGTLELVRGEWRTYNKELYQTQTPPAVQGSISVSSVNIEENSNKEPVNYVMPPGVLRQTDPSQPQLRQQNEQAMVMRVTDIARGDAKAVYKKMRFDLRKYKRLQMFAHAEKMPAYDNLEDNDLSVFIRIGSDLKYNYYEYEIPLKLTPAGFYSSTTAGEVWRTDNMFDFPLSVFTDLKKHRIKEQAPLAEEFPALDPEKPQNKVVVKGNPNLGEIEMIMIGVRNVNGLEPKSGEVWVNELRLTDYDEAGGWGALGNMVIALSDFANVNLSGRYESAGFGGIEQSLTERRMDDYYQFNVATQVQVGRFFPEKAKVNIPFYYSYSIENSKPKYSPLDGDLLLKDALESYERQEQKDSVLKLSQTRTITNSFNVTGVKVDIRGKRPHFYDPANFSFSYAYNKSQMLDPETERNANIDHNGSLNYDFNTSPQTWEPFKNNKKLSKPAYKILKEFGINYSPSRVALAVNVQRMYSETQLRDLEGSLDINPKEWGNPLFSSSKNFTWGRTFNFNYDLTKNLKFTFQSATNSRIDETMLSPVNKRFFPEVYENWKDTVLQSLKHLGTPLTYQQVFSATYNVPINKIPIFDWVTANASYNASYNWNLGAPMQSGLDLGNVISNTANWQIDGQLKFETLYNKSKYLKTVNQRYASRSGSRSRFSPKTIEKTAVIAESGSVDVKHGLNSVTLDVITKNAKGKKAKVSFKPKDKNTITISGNAGDSIALTITTVDPNLVKKITGKDVAAFSTRFLMMVRSASITYRNSSGLSLPGFKGDATLFGQSKLGGVVAPGLDFAFGRPSENYIEKAMSRHWLVAYDDVSSSAIAALNKMEDLDIKANIEPFQGFKINLSARAMSTKNTTIQFLQRGLDENDYMQLPQSFSGSFQITHIAIGTSFWAKNVKLGNARAFELFKNYQGIMANRLEQQYIGKEYPDGTPLRGQTFNPDNGTISKNSSDAIIPAFLAAYSGRSIDKASTKVIPSIWSLLPNWTVSYDGLINIPFIAKRFKSFTLNHSYQSSYGINSYSSYTDYLKIDDNSGFVERDFGGDTKLIPTSGYDIGNVAITENFAPFVGVDFALKNSFTGTIKYNRQRNITLNITSLQIAEIYNNELVFGIGYIIKDFDMLIKLKSNQIKKVKNDLTMRLDFSFKNLSTLLRKIDANEPPQATAGNKTIGVKFTADYVFSSKLNFRLFVDYQSNTPLITTSYPMATTNAGLSIKFMLTR